MKLEIDSLGAPLRPFEELRDELIAAGKKFDAESLSHIPYEKLVCCATGMAGEAMCPLALVQEEKNLRRDRFMSMSEFELNQVNTLLRIEQMRDDVVRQRAVQGTPKWDELTPRQQVWFKLRCIQNHLDAVSIRMTEVADLFCQCIESRSLPVNFAAHHLRKVQILIHVYPNNMPEKSFREQIADIAKEVKDRLTEPEIAVCEAEVLYNHSCTSDCFTPLL